MSTFANSEDPDKMQHNDEFHQGLHCLKEKLYLHAIKCNIYYNHNRTPIDMYNLKFIVSNQKEESISIQRVKYLNFYS